MNPDAAPTLAPIAAGWDGEGDSVAEFDDSGDIVLQAIGPFVLLSGNELDLEVVADAAVDGAVRLEIDVEVSVSAAGTKGVPKAKLVKFEEQQDP